MEPLDPNSILTLLERARQRPRYIVSVLEFKLGREPTQEEINEVYHDYQLRQFVYQRWLEMQPPKVRFAREERIKRIMQKRYNVPERLLEALLKEIENDW